MDDIAQIMSISNLVKENALSNPDSISYNVCKEFLTKRGKGWVCEEDGRVVGFAIVDMKVNNIWALFLHPDYERKGIGKQLHDKVLEWYFERTHNNVCLGTKLNTRAERFYKKSGWRETGLNCDGKEVKFIMTYEDWKALNWVK